MSKIIKARGEELESVLPFGFAELQQQRRSRPDKTNQLSKTAVPFQDLDGAAEAENSVRTLLLDAERKAQELEEEAYRKGYEQGQKDGFEVGQRSMAIVKEHLERLLDSLHQTPQTIFDQYRDWLIQMCLTISRHIVRRELSADHTQLAQLIETLLQETAENHTLTISVHADDLALLEQHLDLKSLRERTGRTFTLVAQPHIQRGGCRAESDVQLFDASLEKRFSFIEQALRNDESIPDHSPA